MLKADQSNRKGVHYIKVFKKLDYAIVDVVLLNLFESVHVGYAFVFILFNCLVCLYPLKVGQEL